jgi:hypothetical protein
VNKRLAMRMFMLSNSTRRMGKCPKDRFHILSSSSITRHYSQCSIRLRSTHPCLPTRLPCLRSTPLSPRSMLPFLRSSISHSLSSKFSRKLLRTLRHSMQLSHPSRPRAHQSKRPSSRVSSPTRCSSIFLSNPSAASNTHRATIRKPIRR